MTIRDRTPAVLAPAIFWLILWGAIGALLSIVIGVVDPPSIDPGEGPIDMARVLGALAAVGFGILARTRRGAPPAPATT